MELNEEWLGANLGEARPRLIGAQMQPQTEVRPGDVGADGKRGRRDGAGS